MATNSYTKDPNAVVDFAIDWSAWLALTPPGTADTISTSTWTVPAGLTKGSEINTTTKATVWLSGGTAGETYEITNRIVTAGGRTYDQTLRIVVREA